ncbi:MAG: hypothetical protein D6770_06350 [Anaerolineae bacterium]|nr:MAG: hypothetical protein D6770_06350 [Anaerolineae bacterium]
MSRDLRHYARQTNFRLLLGALVLLFVVGDGLIYLIYGKGAAVMGLLCLFAGLTPVLLVMLVLALLDWVAKRVDGEG